MQTSERRTISYTLPWDNAPVDLSFIFEKEKPAGKHGFMQAKGGRMVFKDDTEARFWGTNFNSAANFPPHAYSEVVAKRLARFGVNLVRFHQMDGDWSTPNIFQYSKGPLTKNTRNLDPVSMDCLDYLIYCLKQEGIYVYMDMLTYRKFRFGDGADTSDQLSNAARPYSNFDTKLIELQKEFCEKLWNHVNPYTKLAYKNEPAIVMTEIANENEVFGFMKNLLEPYKSRLQERYKKWAKKKGLKPAADVDFSIEDASMISFLVEVQKEYFDEIYKHMRKIGVKIPITGTNWAVGCGATLSTQTDMDFTDSHTYWTDFGMWSATEKKFSNKSMLGERSPWWNPLTCMRLADKPFFVSEWDSPWPNEWRAESPLLLAAVSCLQGWTGTAIHTYRYDCRENVDQIAAPITSDALSGVPYRSGIFDTFNDPAKFGLFYHAALIMRRGDVREGGEATEIVLPTLVHDEKTSALKGLIWDIKAADGTAESRKIAIRLPGTLAKTAKQAPFNVPLVPAGVAEISSETKELYRSIQKKYGYIDTPKTKVAYGFIGAAGEISLKGLTVKASTDFGVIAVSSLSDASISGSDNLLLTAVGRADNTGVEYNAAHTLQLKLGHGPIEVEVIEADLELETKVAGLQIWAVNPAGSLIGRVPAEYRNGKLHFRIGGSWPSMYYLIQKV